MSALASLYSMVATVAVLPDPIDSKQTITEDHHASSFRTETIE